MLRSSPPDSPTASLASATPLKRFIDQMYAAKAAKYFDSLAINSYAKDDRELGRMLGGSASR